MKTPEALLASPEIKEVHQLLQVANERRRQAAYNLFTLSSHNNQKENFHSDVIKSLLAPDGLHKEGNLFLLKFIDYLNARHGRTIPPAHYTHAAVHRETGRLDIWIKDNQSKCSIIIENKMNNAGDMEEQLQRYYEYAKTTHSVDIIIYLSLDGMKTAPLMSESQSGLVVNIGAYTGEADDLVNGWLQPCVESATNEDNRTLIYQYIKLIKHLNQIAMNEEAMQKFYEYIGVPENYDVAITVSANLERIRTHRRDLFYKKWEKGFLPFTSIHSLRQYADCGVLFQDYWKDGFNYKLDVYFGGDGNVLVRLWTPADEHNNEIGQQACFRLLQSIGFADGFEVEKPMEQNSMIAKWFMLDKDKTMQQVDDAVYVFVKKFLEALNK